MLLRNFFSHSFLLIDKIIVSSVARAEKNDLRETCRSCGFSTWYRYPLWFSARHHCDFIVSLHLCALAIYSFLTSIFITSRVFSATNDNEASRSFSFSDRLTCKWKSSSSAHRLSRESHGTMHSRRRLTRTILTKATRNLVNAEQEGHFRIQKHVHWKIAKFSCWTW